jgi:hypothetical protein
LGQKIIYSNCWLSESYPDNDYKISGLLLNYQCSFGYAEKIPRILNVPEKYYQIFYLSARVHRTLTLTFGDQIKNLLWFIGYNVSLEF